MHNGVPGQIEEQSRKGLLCSKRAAVMLEKLAIETHESFSLV